ncbi:MAG TPA: dihydrolipoyl dehydrogenase [Gammaproteobacteria bacterium]|nr:dihydrolipoyl dehydrogenase [Gammaproteobacteria bacterium]
MVKEVDVAIIGAGSAGLYALSQVMRLGKSYVVINGGKLGTTCARVGCMPSKVLIQAAEDFYRRKALEREGIEGGEHLSVDRPEVMEFVRELRDGFVERVIGNNKKRLAEHTINGLAEYVSPNEIRVGDETIHCKTSVIATGSNPVVPAAWQRGFGDHIITTDQIFELEDLPDSVAVVGLGVIGLELGQALSRLEVEVTGIDMAMQIGGIEDPDANSITIEALQREFPLWLGHPAEVSKEGDQLRVTAGENSVLVDKLLVSMGRAPNVEALKLENIGAPLDDAGIPHHNPNTMQCGDAPVYLAGDVTGAHPLLHEAGDDGRIAGINASSDTVTAFKRKTPLAITFCDPNIAIIGTPWSALDHEQTAIGEVKMAPVGRAQMMSKNRGIIRVYADKTDGRLLGATLVCVKGENLAHLLAWCIQQNLTVFDVLRMPFYHPVIEEALQAALRFTAQKVENQPGPVLDIEEL